MKTYSIYRLLNSKGRIFYVGVTTNSILRLISHKSRYGQGVTMEILCEILDRKEAFMEEKRHIKEHINLGYKLKNRKEGRKKVKDKRVAMTFTAAASVVKLANKKGLRTRNKFLESALDRYLSTL